MTVKKLTLTAILTALALALGLLERFLPISLLIPLPGVKLEKMLRERDRKEKARRGQVGE